MKTDPRDEAILLLRKAIETSLEMQATGRYGDAFDVLVKALKDLQRLV